MLFQDIGRREKVPTRMNLMEKTTGKTQLWRFPAWKSLPQQGWVALNGSRGWERADPRKRE